MDIGVAYYPEHWPRERWARDFAVMQDAGITRIRVGEYAWCRIEPRDGEFAFDWLAEALALAGTFGIKTILCTPTQAPPPWLTTNHPDTLPWTPDGCPYSTGARAHIDATSPAALFYCDRIVRALGERFGKDPNVVGWQLHNEIGAHTHFVSTSPWAAVAFREWLRKKYGTCDALNKAWGLIFWSCEVREWNEIELVTASPVGKSPSYIKDFRTWGQEVWFQFLGRQTAILRPLSPGRPITSNIAWHGEQIDLWTMRDHWDWPGIDCYSQQPDYLSATGDLYRAVAQGNDWAVMEMPANDGYYQDAETAGPCTGRLTTTLVKHACTGAVLSSMFREEASPSGVEQGYEYLLFDSAGRPTSTVASVREAKRIIKLLDPVLKRPRTISEVGILWDTDDLIWSEMFPIERRQRKEVNNYPIELYEIHRQCAIRGIRADFVNLNQDLSQYRVLIAWDKLLCNPTQAKKLREYVAAGGNLVGNYLMGFFTNEGRRNCEVVPFQLTDVFGCNTQDLLQPKPGMAPRIAVADIQVEGENHGVTLESQGGEVLATWNGWTGKHNAAIVGNRYGMGQTLYIGALLGPKAWNQLMPLIFTRFALFAQNPIAAHPNVESLPERGAWLVTNSGHEAVKVAVTGTFKDLISGKTIQNELTLPGFGMAVLD